MTNELSMPDSFTLLLGRKPVALPPPIVIKHVTDFETVELDPQYRKPGDPWVIHVPKTSFCQIHSAGRLYATTNRYTLKKDLKTGHITLHLFKNKTRLH